MLLVIDTSGPRLGLGLFPDAEVNGTGAQFPEPVALFEEEIGRGHAERLVPAIRTLLDGRAPSDLTRVAAVAGPGSFMGLRVGLAAARGLALALGIEAVGVSRAQALAWGRGAVEIVLDLRRGEVWRERFAADGTSLGTRVERADGVEIEVETAVPLPAVALLALRHPLPPVPIYGRGADAKPQQHGAKVASVQR